MKKWDIRFQDEVKLGDKCPCHDLYILDGEMKAARTYKLVELCPDALFDWLLAYQRQSNPEALMKRLEIGLILRDV